MNRKEALTFLGLPESAADKEVKKTLDEKIEYYERLSHNASSAFLKRLNTQHLAQVLEIQKQIVALQIQPAFVHQKQEAEIKPNQLIEDQSLLTVPIILSSSARDSMKKATIKKPIAFLIRHTENQSVNSFSLFPGKNYIGRKPHETLSPFIALEEDHFVSRVHAVIFAEEAGTCFIDDSASSNEGKPSKNGTFLNGYKKRISIKTPLQENDTMQIGETKLIFRLNTTNIEKIIEEVQQRDYMHTVVIRR